LLCAFHGCVHKDDNGYLLPEELNRWLILG
jgi:hypothetical protein